MNRTFVLLSAALAGCSPLGACPTDVPAGEITADVDGAAWVSTATYRMAGSNLQINAEPATGWFMTFVLQRTTDGALPGDAIEGDIGKFDVDLADGGFATLYEDGAGSSASGSGTFRVLGYDGASVTACFAYTSDEGVHVGNGSVNATLAE